MAHVDTQGITHGADNSLPELIGEMATNPHGIILLLIPLAILVAILTITRKYLKKRKCFGLSLIISGISYVTYFLILTIFFVQA